MDVREFVKTLTDSHQHIFVGELRPCCRAFLHVCGLCWTSVD
jgi:hypothetical protein